MEKGMKGKLRGLSGGLRRFLQTIRRMPLRPKRAAGLGLALGGGFARGLAHIGVLKVLEENNIPVRCLAGTSIGSIIAGAYASGVSLEEMNAVARKIRWRDFGQWTFSRMGFASNQRLEALVKRFFRATRFEDLNIPLAILAADLVEASPVVFTSGELTLAVRASCAYPGLFLPVEHDGRALVDGMLVSSVPTRAVVDLGATVVLAVSLNNLKPPTKPKSVVEVLGRAFGLAQVTAEPVWREHADVVVEPDVGEFNWDDFARADELVASGKRAMRAALPELRRALRKQQAATGAAAG